MTLKNLRKSFWHYFSEYWQFIFILLVVGLFFWKFFLQGLIPIPADLLTGAYLPWVDYKWGYVAGVPVKNPITSDVISFMYPMQTLSVFLLKSFQFPLWNPYILGGVPLLANFQSAGLNPLNLLYLIIPENIAWSFQIILQHVMAMGFTYLLLRLWKVSKAPSILGGLIFSFSGFNMIWSQWNGHTLTAAYMPLFLFAVSKIFLTKKRIWILVASIILGLQIYSGYPQIVFYTFVSLFLYWIVFRVNLKVLFMVVVLGIGLASPQLLPGVELFSHSQREVEEAHPFEWAFLPWSKVITFIAPDYYGNHATGNYWGPLDYSSHIGFVGTVGLVLATYAIFFVRNKYAVFGTLLVILSLLLSLPTPLSILLWKSGLLGLQAAAAHRALLLFNFGIAMLAAIGISNVMNQTLKKTFHIFIPTFSIIIVFLIISFSSQYTNIALKNMILPIAMFLLSAITILFGRLVNKKLLIFLIPLVVVELFYVGWKFTPFSKNELVFPTTPVIEFLLQQEKPFRITSTVTPVNFLMRYGIETVGGYDAVYPARSAGFISIVNNGVLSNKVRRYALVDQPQSEILNLANVKYITINTSEAELYDKEKYKVVFQDKSVMILENKNALSRFYVVSNYQVETSPEMIIEKLSAKDVLSGNSIILEQYPSFLSTENTFSEVEVITYKPQKIVLNVNSSSQALLNMSDTYYPGWKAFVNGTETKILRANYAFRAIQIPEGRHSIEFIYDPLSFKLGLVIAGITICALILVVWKKDLS